MKLLTNKNWSWSQKRITDFERNYLPCIALCVFVNEKLRFRPFLSKMLLSLSNSLSFACIYLVKPIFLLLRGICSKLPFYEKKLFWREVSFEANLDLSRHPEQVFFDSLPPLTKIKSSSLN